HGMGDDQHCGRRPVRNRAVCRRRLTAELSHTPFNKCPIFDFLVLRYLREIFETRGWHGTLSTTSMPDPSSCRTFSGLLESKRIFLAPSCFRISAGNWYSRASEAKPRASFASTVSIP